MKTIVMVPEPEDRRPIKKFWAKLLTKVDVSKSNGYAFEGEWLRRGERAEVPTGSYILLYDEPGSAKNWYPHVRLLRAEPDGSLSTVLDYDGDINERSWALAVRDQVAAIMAEGAKTEIGIDLSAVSTDALVAELQRRNIL